MKETILSIILRQAFCVDRDAHEIHGSVYSRKTAYLWKDIVIMAFIIYIIIINKQQIW